MSTFDTLRDRFGFPAEGNWSGGVYAVQLAAAVLDSMAGDRSPLPHDAIGKRVADNVGLLPIEVLEIMVEDPELRGVVTGLAVGLVIAVMTEPKGFAFAEAEVKPCICSGPMRLMAETAQRFAEDVTATLNQQIDGLVAFTAPAWGSRAT